MIDYIVTAILAAIVGAAVWYVVRAGKRGAKCIGCPAEGGCTRKGKESACGCGGNACCGCREGEK